VSDYTEAQKVALIIVEQNKRIKELEARLSLKEKEADDLGWRCLQLERRLENEKISKGE